MLQPCDAVADCPERLRLYQIVVAACARVYAVVAGDRARPEYRAELAAARKAERDAIRALDTHRHQHGS